MGSSAVARSTARLAGTGAAYLALAILFTWPLAPSLLPPAEAGHVLAHGPREATAALNTWAMATVTHRLSSDPLHLFDANAFYPFEDSLAFSEHLLVPALLASPFHALSGNWVFAYGALTLLTLALSGLTMNRFVRALGTSETAAFLAGGLYAFHTWNINEVVRIQILSSQWFPLLLLALLRYFERPSRRRAAVVSLAFALQGLSCMYWALYAPLILATAVAFLWWRTRAPLRALGRLAAALAPAVAIVAAFFVPYLRTAERHAFARLPPDSVGIDRYLDVLPGNVLYAHLLGTALPNQNAAHFPGFVALALLLVAVSRRRGPTPLAGWRPLLVTFVVAGFCLSLGPEILAFGHRLGSGPYSLLYDFVPGFRNVRYPERFALVMMLGFAPLAALGLDRLRPRPGGTLAAAVVGFALLEHLAIPARLDPLFATRHIPEVYHWLADRPDVNVVAEWPASRHRLERFDALPMYCSTVHWKRTVEGFTGYFPPTYNFTKWRLFHFPDPDSVRFLERFGVDTLLVRSEPTSRQPPLPGVVLRTFADGTRVLHLAAQPTPAFELPAPVSSLVEASREGWEVQASAPGAERAIDDDEDTEWETPERQAKGDFYRVRFPDPIEVARVSIAVHAPYEFPMHLRLLGQDPSGEWREIPFDAALSYDRLFAELLHAPRTAALDLDPEPRRLSGLRLRITETDPFWMPWKMAELRVYGRSPSAAPRLR